MTVNFSEKSQKGYQNLLNIFEADSTVLGPIDISSNM